MAVREQDKKFFIISIVFHIGILMVLILGFDSTTPLAVFENTNKNDVISAVVLGDTDKSKIIHKAPDKIIQKPEPIKEKPKPQAQVQPPVEKNVIHLKKVDKKKLAREKALQALKKPDIFGKNMDMLSDIKKNKQKDIQKKFQQLLREQSEKTLRQQLLNEQIKLQGAISRQAQGEVNKFKALIVQAIGEKWIVPVQANKHLYTQLLIRIAPGGMVLDVQVTKTSGDPSLDSSARAAVFKASPLPVPADAMAFAAFRQFELKVKPENIMEG